MDLNRVYQDDEDEAETDGESDEEVAGFPINEVAMKPHEWDNFRSDGFHDVVLPTLDPVKVAEAQMEDDSLPVIVDENGQLVESGVQQCLLKAAALDTPARERH